MTTPVFLVNKAGKEVHKAVLDDAGNLLTAEADNADDMRDFEVTSELPEWAEGEHFCGRCFPAGQDVPGDEVPTSVALPR